MNILTMAPSLNTCKSSFDFLCMAASDRFLNEAIPFMEASASRKINTDNSSPIDNNNTNTNTNKVTNTPTAKPTEVARLLCFESINKEKIVLKDVSTNKKIKRKISKKQAKVATKKRGESAKTRRRNSKPNISSTSTSSSSSSRHSPLSEQKTNSRYVRGVTESNKRDFQWNLMFTRLQDFKFDFGHCNVPQGYSQDPELATWVKNQRQAYRYVVEKKTTKRISSERIGRLNQLGFEWRKYVHVKEGTGFSHKTPTKQRFITRQGEDDTPSSLYSENSSAGSDGDSEVYESDAEN